jgi:hypothetical protein
MTNDTPRLEIEYVDLMAFRVAPGNAKDHDIGALIGFIKLYGFRDPVGVDGYMDGLTAEGHGRLQALMLMKSQGDPAPLYIVEEGGAWFVPAVKGYVSENEAIFRGYRLAHNRATELGGWNVPLLKTELTILNSAEAVEISGFTADDLAALNTTVDGPSKVERDNKLQDEIDRLRAALEEIRDLCLIHERAGRLDEVWDIAERTLEKTDEQTG